ncbi:MAG: hypothetical protein WA981_17740 [Glaciecola sp.]
MASEQLKNIFLSASIPLPERDKKYIESADIISIRDAVIALTMAVIPNYRLIWGGHPSITPLINYVLQKKNENVQNHVLLYQSKFFEKYYPADNNQFDNIIQTPNQGARESSLLLMRKKMLSEHVYVAGIFIGGMEGVEEEYDLFREYQPTAALIPLASTGAAAKRLYDKYNMNNDRFLHDYAYSSLFNKYLINNA